MTTAECLLCFVLSTAHHTNQQPLQPRPAATLCYISDATREQERHWLCNITEHGHIVDSSLQAEPALSVMCALDGISTLLAQGCL